MSGFKRRHSPPYGDGTCDFTRLLVRTQTVQDSFSREESGKIFNRLLRQLGRRWPPDLKARDATLDDSFA